MAALQVLQRGVGDQGAVVQLDHLQAVVGAGSAAQVSDAVVGDQLTVREALQATHTHTHILFYSLVLCMSSLHCGPLSSNISILCMFIYCSVDNKATLHLAHTLMCNLAVWMFDQCLHGGSTNSNSPELADEDSGWRAV